MLPELDSKDLRILYQTVIIFVKSALRSPQIQVFILICQISPLNIDFIPLAKLGFIFTQKHHHIWNQHGGLPLNTNFYPNWTNFTTELQIQISMKPRFRTL